MKHHGWLLAPSLISAGVLASSAVPQPSLVHALTNERAVGVHLSLPPAYMLFSPLSRFLDTLSLLSTAQHLVVVLTCLGVVAGWAAVARPGPLLRRARRAAVASCAALLLLLAAYTASAALPRPMAALEAEDADVVRVDFHSHTSQSHDARDSFDEERNRAWHRAGGFDLAYVADHVSVTEAVGDPDPAGNPGRAGEGTSLLVAKEARYHGMYTVVLGLSEADRALIDSRRWLLPGALRAGRTPVSIAAMPGPLEDLTAAARDQEPHFVAVEVSNGAPRAFAQLDRERAALIARADALGLRLVSGSNLHGWGLTVPAWTLVTVPGWRDLPPDSVGVRVEAALSSTDPAATRVVERWRPRATDAVSLALTAPWALAQTLGALTVPERLAWVGWIWMLAGLAELALGGLRGQRPADTRLETSAASHSSSMRS